MSSPIKPLGWIQTAIAALHHHPSSENKSLTEINNGCHDSLQLYQNVLGYALERSKYYMEEQELLKVIYHLLDDQLVRFEIWISEADVKDGTLDFNLDSSGKDSATTKASSIPRCFSLLKETLLDIRILLDGISHQIVKHLEDNEGSYATLEYVEFIPY
jgi:hypothetical protein